MKYILISAIALFSLAGCSNHNTNNGEENGLGLHQNAKGAQDGERDSTERDGTDNAKNDSTPKNPR